MKKTKYLYNFPIWIIASSMIALTACLNMNDDATGYLVRLHAAFEPSFDYDGNTHLISNPCHIVTYTREKDCTPFYILFEDDALISEEGLLIWIDNPHYWPGGYCKFIAYWPANANVIFDDTGNIISADCALLAVSEPLCHLSENPTLTFDRYQNEEESIGYPIGFDVTQVSGWQEH